MVTRLFVECLGERLLLTALVMHLPKGLAPMAQKADQKPTHHQSQEPGGVESFVEGQHHVPHQHPVHPEHIINHDHAHLHTETSAIKETGKNTEPGFKENTALETHSKSIAAVFDNLVEAPKYAETKDNQPKPTDMEKTPKSALEEMLVSLARQWVLTTKFQPDTAKRPAHQEFSPPPEGNKDATMMVALGMVVSIPWYDERKTNNPCAIAKY